MYHKKEETITELRWGWGRQIEQNGTDPNIAHFKAAAWSEHCVSIYEARSASLEK